MEIYYLIGFAILIAFFAVQSYAANKNSKELLRRKIREAFGARPDREYSYEEFERISHYFLSKKGDEFVIDDITWNDLDMDTIFILLNNTRSSAGEEYLYKLLRTPEFNDNNLSKRKKLSDFLRNNTDITFKLSEIFSYMGRTKSISLFDFIYRLKDLGTRKSLVHFGCIGLLIISIIVMLINPPVGVILLIAAIAINVILYYKIKAQVESYFVCFKYVVGMLSASDKIVKLSIPELKEYSDVLHNEHLKIKGIERGIGLLTSNSMSGSLSEIIMDYVRMITHVDLIKFNSMLKCLINNIDSIDMIFETLGKIEAGIAIASFKEYLPYFCTPELDNSSSSHVELIDVYHPMIANPVVNSISENRGVLLTGSNASGKSTFLKTVAINALIAQTVNISFSNKYCANYFKIYSSMALRDDLQSNESYYIVEIKSLKRILDSINSSSVPVLCFVDEVLRGTNTVERIAASSQILSSLNKENVMCFAATHDVELTHILENIYSNYHFQEDVKDNDVLFNYKLFEGRATSRNAIKLLGIIGYEPAIIKSAEDTARRFIDDGIWEL